MSNDCNHGQDITSRLAFTCASNVCLVKPSAASREYAAKCLQVAATWVHHTCIGDMPGKKHFLRHNKEAARQCYFIQRGKLLQCN